MREDLGGISSALHGSGPLAVLAENGGYPLGELVVLDCPQVSPAFYATLAQLDVRAAQSGTQVVVLTSIAALEDVFAYLDQSSPQILVDPSRAERMIALGHALACGPDMRLRELSSDDRVTLLRLTEQVARMAERLESLGSSPGLNTAGDAFRFESRAPGYNGQEVEDTIQPLARAARPALPDARLVRRIIRHRQGARTLLR